MTWGQANKTIIELEEQETRINAKKDNLGAVNVKPCVSLIVAKEMTEIALRCSLLI